jgi:hypothetical protein
MDPLEYYPGEEGVGESYAVLGGGANLNISGYTTPVWLRVIFNGLGTATITITATKRCRFGSLHDLVFTVGAGQEADVHLNPKRFGTNPFVSSDQGANTDVLAWTVPAFA